MTNGGDEIQRARSALRSLDSGCPREAWVRLGMAAKAAGLGFDDFHSWSAGAPNYRDERDCLNAWVSFLDGAVKAATLFHAARAAGWQDPGTTRHNASQAARTGPQKLKTPTPPKASHIPRIDLLATFESYPPVDASHAYIVAKRGTPTGLRVVPQDDPLTIRGQALAGSLVVPIRSLDGELLTIQYIPPPGAGEKRNAAGASFGNGMFLVGEISAAGRIYICEGIGQAWAVARADYDTAAIVAFGAGRFRAVALVLRERYPDAHIIFVPDRDKESQAETIACEVSGAWVEMPTDKPANYDANDYEAEHNTEALADLLKVTKVPLMRYRLQSGEDLLNAPPLRWFVRGVLPADGLAALYGPSGSGKSFLALDLCAAIADGAPEWFGKRVTAAPVTYCALEGERGMGKRAQAWRIQNRRPLPARLRFVTQGIDLRQASDIADLAAAVLAAGGRDGLLVIDTLNRAAPGADENASKDMGELIKSCKELQRRIGGLVLLVHHTGKDGTKGLRGHSSLYAALDAAIEVSRTDNRREWSIAKSKDDEDGERTAFRLHVVELGDDERGEPVTSCIVSPDDSAPTAARPKPRGKTQNIVYSVLKDLLRDSKDFAKGGAPIGRPCVELEAVVPIIAEHLPCRRDQKLFQVRRALSGMTGEGKIYQTGDGWLWAN